MATRECVIAIPTVEIATNNFLVLRVVKACIDPARKRPRTLHHMGRGVFMVAGRTMRLPSRMK